MKLLLRDPMPYPALHARLRQLGFNVTTEQNEWLQEHAGHANLSLENGRLYCRTCRKVSG